MKVDYICPNGHKVNKPAPIGVHNLPDVINCPVCNELASKDVFVETPTKAV